MGPRTSIQIGKNSIEGRAPSYFLIFSSDALVAAKPLSLLHLPALQGIKVHPSGRLPSCAAMPDGSFKTGIEALEKNRKGCNYEVDGLINGNDNYAPPMKYNRNILTSEK
ncbi:hypothetical protein HELRODRAFT_184264 [Helobdella robusta]|uniref:Uncharacterized protein n=1 Tax=Helobdella robusta TaxID=6412 RepID=T1FKV5_HELRO|nr:hypothetical protein HELRODRAFT_184264 [Helobdella robusta]ESO03839.1 hypothetical protein HELRODRAFT_184264 [Helobdella robusta]